MAVVLERHRRGQANDRVIWRTWLRLGAMPRIELSVHLYLLLTVVAVTCLLAMLVLPRLFVGWPPETYVLVAIAVAALDCLAGLVHELGHAVVATARGRRVHAIVLYGLGATVKRAGGPTHAKEQLEIALAGPIGQLLIASLLLAIWRLATPDNEALRVATGLPAVSHLAMGAVNLLPLKPLDGGHAATALLAATSQVGSPLTGAIISRRRSES